MRIVRPACLMLVAWAVLCACTATGAGGSSDAITLDTGSVVVAGSYREDGTHHAAYWVDGERVTLDTSASVARSVFVYGDDVYAAGYVDIGGDQPCYWKNGQRHVLTAPNNVRARAIHVENGVPYTAGDTTNDDVMYCWEGTTYTMTREKPGIFVEDVFVSGGDVYIAGTYETDDEPPKHVACYWMNGARVELAEGEDGTRANAIAVHDGDVYVAGAVVGDGGDRKAIYWDNTTQIILAEDVSASAVDVDVHGGDVYVAGQYWSGSTTSACYWRSGQFFEVGDGSYFTRAHGIHVTDDHVYVACEDATYYNPWYWVDGTRIVVDAASGFAYDIAVVE